MLIFSAWLCALNYKKLLVSSQASDGAHESILILRCQPLPWWVEEVPSCRSGSVSFTAVQLLPVEDSEIISVGGISQSAGLGHSPGEWSPRTLQGKGGTGKLSLLATFSRSREINYRSVLNTFKGQVS